MDEVSGPTAVYNKLRSIFTVVYAYSAASAFTSSPATDGSTVNRQSSTLIKRGMLQRGVTSTLRSQTYSNRYYEIFMHSLFTYSEAHTSTQALFTSISYTKSGSEDTNGLGIFYARVMKVRIRIFE